MKPVIYIIFKYTLILFITLFAQWWAIELSEYVPQYIPETRINISGMVIFAATLSILIFGQKEIFRRYPQFSIIKLTALGLSICAIAELDFMLFSRYVMKDFDIYNLLEVFFKMMVFDGGLAFLVAFKIVRPKSDQFWLLIIAFLGLVYLLTII
ncbi:hypothetical protein GCM10023149_41450 [Mucilaginibacter gynuensis]|uniref:Uncharacterized protein n=1 Tax=Mucilaginibacter gynuensis TaxID=1302236 RepID=A0ABP8H4J2_9SPHI